MTVSCTSFKKLVTTYTNDNMKQELFGFEHANNAFLQHGKELCLKGNLLIVVGGCLVCVFCALYLVLFTHKCSVHPQG